MSNPSPLPPTAPIPAATTGTRPKRSRETRWVVGMAIVLVLGPLGYYAGRREIAKWYQAASHTELYTGQYDQALQGNRRALRWDANNHSLWRDRVTIDMAIGDSQAAVQSSERLLELAREAYERRSSPFHQAQLAEALNNCAYAIALDNSDDVDAKEIERALDLSEQSLKLAVEDANILDTRGYVYHLAGQDELAIADAEKAVALMERTYKLQLHQIREQSRGYVDRTRFEYYQSQIHEAMAVLLYHRGLIYQRADRLEAAERDFQRAKDLGYEPAAAEL